MKSIKILITAVLLLLGCQSCDQFAPVRIQQDTLLEPGEMLALTDDTFLLVEHVIDISGTSILGSSQASGLFQYIDRPYYGWNEEKKILTSDESFPIEGKDILYGYYIGLSGEAGSGAGSLLIAVTEVPFTTKEGAVWEKLDKDGTVHLRYEGKSFTLKPGQKVQRKHYQIKYQKMNLLMNETTEWFVNHGFLSLSQVNGRVK